MIKKSEVILIFFFLFVSSTSFAQEDSFLSVLKDCKHSTNDSNLRHRLNKMDSCYLGLDLPEFKTKTIDGEMIDVKSLKGNIIVINIWSLWCGPCIAEIPGLNELVKKYTKDKVVFLALTNERIESIKKFLNNGNNFDFKIIPDAKNIFYRKLDSFGFPRTMVIDKDGIIRSCFSGGVNSKDAPKLIKEKLSPIIDKLLSVR